MNKIFDLQTFAEKEKTFTQEEVNALISKRLERETKKMESEYQKRLSAEREEIEKVANLNSEQKLLLQKDKLMKEIEQREQEIKEKRTYSAV